jgi:hypothetical protein
VSRSIAKNVGVAMSCGRQGLQEEKKRMKSRLATSISSSFLRKNLGDRILVSTLVAVIVTSLSLNARAQDVSAGAKDERQYTDGPVTEEDYIGVEYGHFEEYIDWLNSTWKPTMEAFKKAGLIIDYKVFRLTPKSPDQPNIILWITFKNGMAALDKGVELEAVAKQVIGSTEVQNKARVHRNDYRKVMGTELIRELILK